MIKRNELLACDNCYKLLKECVSFENIENRELICKNLNMIREYRNQMSTNLYSQFEHFVNEVIKPIAFDSDYFSFLKKDAYGSRNEEGHFVINSENSLEMIIFEMYDHCLNLNQKLDEFVVKQLKLNRIVTRNS